MKALILVGGYGTRLRPLTLSVPKPLINFCNRSIVEYQVASFKRAGVDHLILAVAHQPDALMEALEGLETKYGLKISCSKEDEPLGTGGPIRLAKSLLLEDDDPAPAAAAAKEGGGGGGIARSIAEETECFFVCNSDVICSFPLEAMWAFHKQTAAEATILVTKVSDPSKFGVVIHGEDGKVTRFVEKPETYVGNWINAGVYILNKSCIDRIPLGRCSIEKEVFPQLAADGGLFCFHLQGYWADIGQPRDFLEGMSLYLQDLRGQRDGAPHSNGSPLTEGPGDSAGGVPPPAGGALNKGGPPSLPGEELRLVSLPSQEMSLVEGPNIIGNVLVDPSATIGEGSVLGPNVSVDSGVCIGRGCRLKNCAIMRGVRVSDFAWIDSSILGWQSSVGKWVRVEGLTVVGENVHIEDECLINGAFILPHKTISHSVSERQALPEFGGLTEGTLLGVRGPPLRLRLTEALHLVIPDQSTQTSPLLLLLLLLLLHFTAQQQQQQQPIELEQQTPHESIDVAAAAAITSSSSSSNRGTSSNRGSRSSSSSSRPVTSVEAPLQQKLQQRRQQDGKSEVYTVDRQLQQQQKQPQQQQSQQQQQEEENGLTFPLVAFPEQQTALLDGFANGSGGPAEGERPQGVLQCTYTPAGQQQAPTAAAAAARQTACSGEAAPPEHIAEAGGGLLWAAAWGLLGAPPRGPQGARGGPPAAEAALLVELKRALFGIVWNRIQASVRPLWLKGGAPWGHEAQDALARPAGTSRSIAHALCGVRTPQLTGTEGFQEGGPTPEGPLFAHAADG
ncbi:hypothetical protein Efla_004823 [Eimeria flavescens]